MVQMKAKRYTKWSWEHMTIYDLKVKRHGPILMSSENIWVDEWLSNKIDSIWDINESMHQRGLTPTYEYYLSKIPNDIFEVKPLSNTKIFTDEMISTLYKYIHDSRVNVLCYLWELASRYIDNGYFVCNNHRKYLKRKCPSVTFLSTDNNIPYIDYGRVDDYYGIVLAIYVPTSVETEIGCVAINDPFPPYKDAVFDLLSKNGIACMYSNNIGQDRYERKMDGFEASIYIPV